MLVNAEVVRGKLFQLHSGPATNFAFLFQIYMNHLIRGNKKINYGNYSQFYVLYIEHRHVILSYSHEFRNSILQ